VLGVPLITVPDTIATAEETLATVPGKEEKMFNKEKKITEDISEEGDFNFLNMIGQELSKTEKRS
jgi:DNA-binding ferritin-like protein